MPVKYVAQFLLITTADDKETCLYLQCRYLFVTHCFLKTELPHLSVVLERIELFLGFLTRTLHFTHLI